MTGNSDSPQIKLFNEFNRGFKEKNLDLIAEHLHKDFRRCTYPRSLNKPEQNREEWLKHFSGIIAFATEFDVGYTGCFSNVLSLAQSLPQSNVHSIIEAPGKVILHVRIPIRSDKPPVYLLYHL